MKIINDNIPSIPTTLQSILDIVLGNVSRVLRVLAFTETRLDDNLALVYHLPGYKIYTMNRNRHGGGVALYYIADNLFIYGKSNFFVGSLFGMCS